MSAEVSMLTKHPSALVCSMCRRLERSPDVAVQPRDVWMLEPFGKFWCARHIEELAIDILAAFDSGAISGHELLILITALKATKNSAGVRSGHEFAELLSVALMQLADEMKGHAA